MLQQKRKNMIKPKTSSVKFDKKEEAAILHKQYFSVFMQKRNDDSPWLKRKSEFSSLQWKKQFIKKYLS